MECGTVARRAHCAAPRCGRIGRGVECVAITLVHSLAIFSVCSNGKHTSIGATEHAALSSATARASMQQTADDAGAEQPLRRQAAGDDRDTQQRLSRDDSDQCHDDEEEDSDAHDRSSGETLRAQAAAPFSLTRSIASLFPILSWFPRYSLRRHLAGDVVAGVTVGLMVIPQGLGYASVAGVGQVYGLYSAFAGVGLYAMVGGCRDISVGPTAILSLLTFQAVHGDASQAVQLTFLVGLAQLVLASLRLGSLVRLISNPVLSGFTSASAVQIMLTQVGKVCGFKTRSEVYYALYDIFSNLRHLRLGDVLLGTGCMVLLYGMSKLKGWFPHSRLAALVCVARNAIIVCLTGAISYAIYASNGGRDSAVPWKLVGAVPGGMPSPLNPWPSGTMWREQVGAATMTAVVGFLESIAIARAFARANGYESSLSNNHELWAIGVCNLFGSFMRALPSTGSFSRTAVASQAGARTQAQGLVTCLVVVLALCVATPAFRFIPQCVLAAVVIVAAAALVDVRICLDLWRLGFVGKMDLATLLVSFLGCLLLEIQYGIVLGVAASIALLLMQMARPRWSVLRANNNARGVDGAVAIEEEGAESEGEDSSLVTSSTPVLGSCALLPPLPPSVLLLRVDSSLVWFNIERVVRLVREEEVRRFELVPVDDEEHARRRREKRKRQAARREAINAAIKPDEKTQPLLHDSSHSHATATAPFHPAICSPLPDSSPLDSSVDPCVSQLEAEADDCDVHIVQPEDELAMDIEDASMTIPASASVAMGVFSNLSPNFADASASSSPSKKQKPQQPLRPGRLRVLVLDLSSCSVLDTSAARELHALAISLRTGARASHPVSMHFAATKPHVRALLMQTLPPAAFPHGLHAYFHSSVAACVRSLLAPAASRRASLMLACPPLPAPLPSSNCVHASSHSNTSISASASLLSPTTGFQPAASSPTADPSSPPSSPAAVAESQQP